MRIRWFAPNKSLKPTRSARDLLSGTKRTRRFIIRSLGCMIEAPEVEVSKIQRGARHVIAWGESANPRASPKKTRAPEGRNIFSNVLDVPYAAPPGLRSFLVRLPWGSQTHPRLPHAALRAPIQLAERLQPTLSVPGHLSPTVVVTKERTQIVCQRLDQTHPRLPYAALEGSHLAVRSIVPPMDSVGVAGAVGSCLSLRNTVTSTRVPRAGLS